MGCSIMLKTYASYFVPPTELCLCGLIKMQNDALKVKLTR